MDQDSLDIVLDALREQAGLILWSDSVWLDFVMSLYEYAYREVIAEAMLSEFDASYDVRGHA